MDDLVARLSTGKHRVLFETQSKEMLEIKKRLLDLKYVFLKFTDTNGGTELGIHIDETLTSIKNSDFENGLGEIHIVGICSLNYQRIRCTADVNLATKEGIGYVEIIDSK